MVKTARSGEADVAASPAGVASGDRHADRRRRPVVVTGDQQAKLMSEQQPMKMAAAEAATASPRTVPSSPCSRSATSRTTRHRSSTSSQIPGLTSFLAASGFTRQPVTGIDELAGRVRRAVRRRRRLRAEPRRSRTGRFRLMIGLGIGSAALALASLWYYPQGHDRRQDRGSAGWRLVAIRTPFLASVVRLDLHRDGPPAVDRRAEPDRPLDGVWLLTARRVSTVVSAWHGRSSRWSPSRSSTACSRVVWCCLCRYAAEGVADSEPDVSPTAETRRATAAVASPTETPERTVEHVDRLVPAHRRPLDRLPRPGGLRLRRRHAAARPRPQRTPTRRVADQHDRPGVGRQRGVAAHRRRRDLRRVPRVVRHAVLAASTSPLLLILVALIVRGRRLRVAQQVQRRPRGGRGGDRALIFGSWRPWRSCGASPSRNIVRGVPLDADHQYVGTFFDPAERRSRCSAARRRRSSSSRTARCSSRSRRTARCASAPAPLPRSWHWLPPSSPARGRSGCSWRTPRCCGPGPPSWSLPRALVAPGGHHRGCGVRAGRSSPPPSRSSQPSC